MRIKIPEPLPKNPLPGVVLPQWIRCGKSNCRCALGELHGPYHYRFWRENGKLRKQYVKKADVDEIRARCQARQQWNRDLQDSENLYQEMLSLLRQVELS